MVEGAPTPQRHGSPDPGVADAMTAVLRPVRAGNAFEETVERLLTAIKLGLIGAGQRLPAERDLAARLDVSRMTLREAIHSLRAAGYVECRRGRLGGTFVVRQVVSSPHHPGRDLGSVPVAELTDTLALREALETGVVTIAARRSATRSQRAHVERCLREVAHADLAGYRLADSRLHLALAELTGSPSLVAALAEARMRINDLLDAIPLLERNLAHANQQHTQIVAAVLGGAPEAARQAMAEHLAGTAALLRGFLG